MFIDDFVWLAEIANKVARKHRVTQDQVEEVFFKNPRFRFVESEHRSGEDVYSAGGQTDAGRYLIVFFIYKGDRTDGADKYEVSRHRSEKQQDLST